MSKRSKIQDLNEPEHHQAELAFGIAAFAIALFLAVRLPWETTWVSNQPLQKQPALWPIVSIAGMTLFGLFELLSCWRRNALMPGAPVLPEVLNWTKALEFALWFMAYVFIVPVMGYLPTTLAFCAALTIRLGYRTRRMIIAALLTGLATVVIFKSWLSVKIPGAAVYEHLPDGLRNFAILYL